MHKPNCPHCSQKTNEILHGFYLQFKTVASMLDDSDGKVERWKYEDFLLWVLADRLKKDNPIAKYPTGEKILESLD